MRWMCTRVVVASLAFTAAAQAQFSGPTPYLSAADSPYAGLSFGWFHLEDFEDDSLTPGLGAFNGERIGPSNFTDSVDADDGTLDGSGTRGSSYITDGFSANLEFTFDAGVLGAYPTHAGFVWTDVGFVFQGDNGFSNLVVEAFDASDASIGTYGPFMMGDGASTGATAEDRFFGIVHAGGISRLVITMPDSADWEVDHVQYGLIPAPSSALVLLACLARRRRR